MIDPIVSTEWLDANSHLEDLFIIDIRDPVDYAAGHIPGSINEPFVTSNDSCTGPSSNWITGTKDCVWLEIPDGNDLFRFIGELGITKDSRVVIVTSPNPNEPPLFGIANALRVADTLIYAGVKNVAALDGGYPKWALEGRSTTKEVPTLKSSAYQSEINKTMFVSMDYVNKQIGKAIIIDARDEIDYSGQSGDRTGGGHISTAVSLPAAWIWNHNPDGTYTYKDPKTLAELISPVIGRSEDSKSQEIIVYCGVGGYASAWWYILTQVLGYDGVKIYDGSAQEWIRDHDMVID